MPRAAFSSDPKRNTFYFIDDDRSMFESIEFGMAMEITVKDQEGSIVTIPFRVIRNTFLGSYVRKIHGEVLETEDDLYRQIEIRLNFLDPSNDTIGVYLQAPPIGYEKPGK